MVQADRSAGKKPFWKKAVKPAIFIALGILIAFPLFSMSYYTMVRASTPDFCALCHEIKPAVVAWRSSTHANNATGVVVDCMDCHLPGPQDTFKFFFTLRPQDFKAFPSGTNWQDERQKMKNICSACHGNSWNNDFYDGFDKAVQEYSEVYFKPAKAKLDELYEKGLLDKTKFFDEHLEVEYYELWRHEGRRARMGAMMMAPDYAWWHGFYECKLRFANYMEEANHLIETGKKAYISKDFPNATGSTERPKAIFKE